MPDQTDFIDMSNRNEAIAARFKKLWDDLVSARKDRGWPNGSFTPPTADGKTFITNESMNTLRDLATYNGVGPRYVNNFPAFDAYDGSEIRGNFLNEIQLVINDTKNGVGCNQGCTYVCIGCTNLCSGSSCTNTCGVAACTVNCGSECSGNACSANCSSGCSRSCDNTCGSGCGGDTCSSSCSGSCVGSCLSCYSACSGGCEASRSI